MKLAILSRAPRSYSTQRLRAAALMRGHEVKVLNTLRFAIDLSGDEQATGVDLLRGRRVEPNATRVLASRRSSLGARRKSSSSFGFAPGQPASM